MQTVQFFFCVQKTCPDCTSFLYGKKTWQDWISFFLSAVTICFLYNKIRLEKSVQDKQGDHTVYGIYARILNFKKHTSSKPTKMRTGVTTSC